MIIFVNSYFFPIFIKVYNLYEVSSITLKSVTAVDNTNFSD
jgi:hypothetical protein